MQTRGSLLFSTYSIKGCVKNLLMVFLLVGTLLMFCRVQQDENIRHHHQGFSIFVQGQSLNAFSASQKQAIVDKHNLYRLQDSLNPPATDMLTIAWDETLAQTAADYVDGCAWGHNSARGNNVGENIFLTSSSNNPDVDAVTSWASEKADYSYENGCKNGAVCGHYTQMIWASTNKVGCAFKTCGNITNSEIASGVYVVCDYSPAGNYQGEKPYSLSNSTNTTEASSNSTSTASNETLSDNTTDIGSNFTSSVDYNETISSNSTNDGNNGTSNENIDTSNNSTSINETAASANTTDIDSNSTTYSNETSNNSNSTSSDSKGNNTTSISNSTETGTNSTSNSTSSTTSNTNSFGLFSKTVFNKTEILAHRAFLLNGVSEIASNLYTSYFFTHGTNAFPIIVSEDNKAVAIAASFFGKGRICAFGNQDFMTKTGNNGLDTLLTNCIKWTTQSKSSVQYLLHDIGSNSLLSSISGLTKYTNTTDAFDPINKPLETVDLLFLNLIHITTVTPEMTSMIRGFLERGGAIITGALGFYHPLQNEPNIFPGHLWFADFGVTFYNTWYATGRYLAATEAQVLSDTFNPYWTLDTLLKDKPQTISIDTLYNLREKILLILDTLPKPITIDSCQTFYKIAEVYTAYCASVTLKSPFKTDSEKQCTKFVTLMNYINSLPLPLESNPEILTAETVTPGPCLHNETFRNTPITSNQVEISTIRTAWQCTGYYVVPGGVVSISLNSTKGVNRIVIGGHTDDISRRDSWPRFPVVSLTKRIDSQTLTTGEFVAYSGGIIFVDVNSKPLDLLVNVTGQVVKVPFWKKGVHTNQDWLTIRNYSAPFVEIEGTHFVLGIKATPQARTVDDVQAIADYWGESVMNLYYDLSQRGVRPYKERYHTDVEISAGYMHSGYPMMAYDDQDLPFLFVNNPASLPLKPNTQYRWGPYHELGHNFAEGAWSYEGTTELSPNYFTLYAEEHYPGGAQTYGERDYNPPNREGEEYKVMKSTEPFKGGANGGDWAFVGLLFQMDLIKGFGWVAMKKFLGSYVNSPYQAVYINQTLATPDQDLDKRNQWLLRYSNIVQRNLAPFFALYNFPVSQSAIDAVSIFPKWMPNDFVIDCSNAIYPESPCMSMSISDNRNGTVGVKYSFNITAWSPIKPYYGEHLVISFSGNTAPRFQNNQTITLTDIVGEVNPQVTAIVTPEKVILPIYSNFIASGQKIMFSFTITNSYRVGQINTTVKHINSKGGLINVLERPLEIQKSIILSDEVGPMLCDFGFYGSDCSIATCFEYIGSDPRVCSGNGKCVNTDTCQCTGQYFGPECQDVETLSRELVLNHTNFLLNGLSTIVNDYSAYYYVHGPNAFPLFMYGKVPGTIAATYKGKGRIIGLSGRNYLHPETFNNADLITFMTNAVRWLTKKKRNVKFMIYDAESSFYSGLDGFTMYDQTTDIFDPVLKPLESIDFLVLGLQDVTTITDSMKASIVAFLERGGGIITGTLSWWYPYSENYDPVKFPGNILFAELGITFVTNYPYGTPVASTSYSLDNINVYWRIQTALSTKSISAITSDDMLTLKYVISSVPASNLINLPLFADTPTVYSTLCTNVTAKSSFCVLWKSTMDVIANYTVTTSNTTANATSNSTIASNNNNTDVSSNNSTSINNSTSSSSNSTSPAVNEFTSEEKIAILVRHNEVRFGVLNPPAASMGSLSWDTELERVATEYASKCIWAHNSDRTSQYVIGYVGENIYASGGKTGIVDGSVSAWASEAEYYTYASNSCQSGKACGHYTQLVWEKTKKVGCAKKTCQTWTGLPDSFNGGTFVVCDYYPGGNFNGESPYVKLVTNSTDSSSNSTASSNNSTNSTDSGNSTNTDNNGSQNSTNNNSPSNNSTSNSTSNENTQSNNNTSTNNGTENNSSSSNNTTNTETSNNGTTNSNNTGPITCNTIEVGESGICSGNGDCIAIDTCVCRDNFEGTWCENCKVGFELVNGKCKQISQSNNSTNNSTTDNSSNNSNGTTSSNNTYTTESNNSTSTDNSTQSSNSTSNTSNSTSNSTTNSNTESNNSTTPTTNNSTTSSNSTSSNSTNPTTSPAVNELSSDEKIAMLARHNEVRFGVLNPPAASMGALTWDDELERVATEYASKCIWAHNDERTSQYVIGYVGENIYASGGKSNIVNSSVSAWASEYQYYTYSSNSCQSGKACGHYTQLVWEKTKKVGCARKTCETWTGLGAAFNGGTFVVCDYYPGGNFNGEKPYVAQVITCNAVSSDSSDVCSGNGACTATDTCVCKDSFEGKWCESCKNGLELVDGKCLNTTGAKCAYDCGSNGVCTSEGICSCSNGFITTDIKKPCSSCPVGKIADASGRSCICNVEYGYSAGSDECSCNQALGFIEVSGSCICNDKKGFISKQGSQCLCRTAAGYSNENGECIRSSPICSNGCGNGQCYFLNTLTNATDCKCNQGYTTTIASSPCSSCATGYTQDGKTCKKVCANEYSGDDCTIYTPTPTCASIPSTALTFCKSSINLDNYRVKSSLFTSGAMNSTHAKELLISGIKKLDSQASSTYTQTLTSFQNQGLSCDSTCRSSLAKLICFETISTCQLVNNQPEEKRICKTVCDYIISKEIQNSTISFSDSCSTLPESSCYYGSYLPPNTQCYGKLYTNSLVCSGHGDCIDVNTCSCKSGYDGSECQYNVCFQKDSNTTGVCSGHGDCYSPNSCKCEIGFTGIECFTPTCNGKSEIEGGCSFHGQCLNSHTCSCSGNFAGSSCSTCKSGFTGQNCDIPICNNILSTDKKVCSGRGSCESVNGQPTCVCNSGFDGSSCQNFKCNGTDRSSSNVCSQHGKCTNVDTCICDGNYDSKYFCSKCLPSFDGDSCTHRICSEKDTCNSRGTCNDQFKCVCSANFYGDFCEKCIDGWVGSDCSIACSATKNCNGKGTCNQDGSCKCNGNFVGVSCDSCKPGWYGDKCDFSIDETTFEFNENGDMITGTVYSSLKKKISCSELIQNSDSIGVGAVCSLNADKNSVQIILGQNPSIQIGGTLQLKKYPNVTITIDTVNAIVKGTNYKIVAPSAGLIATPTSVSKACGRIYLDASNSVSLDRRPLIFTWSTLNGPSSSDIEMLDSLISTQTSSGISFEASKLGVGSYTVQVIVKSSFSGEKTTASVVFTVSAETAPILTIKEGLESSMIIGSPFIITPVISFPSCYSGSGAITYTYSVEKSAASITLKQLNDLLVFSDDFTKVTEEGDYYFTLKAQQSGAASASISFKVTAKALPLKVSFSIRDMQQSFEDPVHFLINKQDPSNPSDSTGQVKLSCVNLDTATTCKDFDNNAINIDQSSLEFNNSMTAGLYMFTATFTKSTRTISTSVKVTVLDQSKSAVIRISIAPPTSTDLTAVDPSSDLLLQATTLDYVSSKRVFTWSSSDIEFDSSIATNKKYLIIPKTLLSPGASYTIKVSLVDGTKQGDAEISFTVNSPPTIGILEISPSTGVALKDEFQIKCGNGWSDNQLPLSYKFLYKLTTDSTWSLLSEQSEKRSVSTSLPAGNLQIKAVVFDALGAYSETIGTVTVSIPDASTALQALYTEKIGSVSVSSLTSILSVVSTVTTQSAEEKQAVQSAGKAYVEKFFEQQAAEEQVVSESSAGTSSKLSAISSISNAAANLPDDTVSMIIGKFSSTVGSASDSSNIKMSSDDVTNTRNTADKLKEHVESNLAKRSIKIFTQSDLNNLDSVYSKLVNVELKSAVADMPASRVKGINSFSYARLLSVATLSGLSESLKVDVNSPFSISSEIETLPILSTMDSVKLVMKSYLNTNASIKAVSSIYDFNVLDSSNKAIDLSSSNGLATLTLDSISSGRSLSEQTIVCSKWNGADFIASSGCSIISNTSLGVQISIQSSGSYVLLAKETTTINPIPSTSTTQQHPQVSDSTGVVKLKSHDGNYIAFVLFAIPLVSLVAVITGFVYWYLKSRHFTKMAQGHQPQIDIEMGNINRDPALH